MYELLLAAAIGVAVIVVVLGVIYVLIRSRSRRVGTSGYIQRSRLHCPNCNRDFDYDWVPGGSFTALRLGRSRYMACPLCHRWSVFPIVDAMIRRPPGGGPSPPP